MSDQESGVDAVAAVRGENQSVFFRRAGHLEITDRSEQFDRILAETCLEAPVLLQRAEVIDDKISRAVVLVDLRQDFFEFLDDLLGDADFQKTEIVVRSEPAAKRRDLRIGEVRNKRLQERSRLASAVGRALGAVVAENSLQIVDSHARARAIRIAPVPVHRAGQDQARHFGVWIVRFAVIRRITLRDHGAPAVRVNNIPRPRLERLFAQFLDVFDDITGAQKPIVFLAAIDRALRHSARVEVHDVVLFLQQPQSRRPILGVDDGARPAGNIKDVPPLLLIQVKPVAEKICELKLAA